MASVKGFIRTSFSCIELDLSLTFRKKITMLLNLFHICFADYFSVDDCLASIILIYLATAQRTVYEQFAADAQ
jgi:hypothetical protein